MTDPAAGTPDDLTVQFERAERAGQTPGVACAICQQPIAGSYYEINGAAAAALGGGAYFGIEALTGYEVGRVAVVA